MVELESFCRTKNSLERQLHGTKDQTEWNDQEPLQLISQRRMLYELHVMGNATYTQHSIVIKQLDRTNPGEIVVGLQLLPVPGFWHNYLKFQMDPQKSIYM